MIVLIHLGDRDDAVPLRKMIDKAMIRSYMYTISAKEKLTLCVCLSCRVYFFEKWPKSLLPSGDRQRHNPSTPHHAYGVLCACQ